MDEKPKQEEKQEPEKKPRKERVLMSAEEREERKANRTLGAWGTGSYKYQHNFPTLLVSMMSEGRTRQEFCKEVGINTHTFYKYVKEFKEFGEAYGFGKIAFEAHFTEYLRKNLENMKINGTVLSTYTKYVVGWGKNEVRPDNERRPLSTDNIDEINKIRARFRPK